MPPTEPSHSHRESHAGPDPALTQVSWHALLNVLRATSFTSPAPAHFLLDRDLLWIIDLSESDQQTVVVKLFVRSFRGTSPGAEAGAVDGAPEARLWSRLSLREFAARAGTNPELARVIHFALEQTKTQGAADRNAAPHPRRPDRQKPLRRTAQGRGDYRLVLPGDLAMVVLPVLASTSQLAWSLGGSESPQRARAVTWRSDPDAAWDIGLKVEEDDCGGWQLTGFFSCGTAQCGMSDVVAVLPGDLLLLHDALAPCTPHCRSWLESFRRRRRLHIAPAERRAFLETLCRLPASLKPLHVDAPATFGLYADLEPQPEIWIDLDQDADPVASVFFCYGHIRCQATSLTPRLAQAGVIETRTDVACLRQVRLEQERLWELQRLGITGEESRSAPPTSDAAAWHVPRRAIGAVAKSLSERGWQVFVNRSRFRLAECIRFQVFHRDDGFRFRLEFVFADAVEALPDVTRVLRTRTEFVSFADGTCTQLPESWQQKLTALARFSDASATQSASPPSNDGCLALSAPVLLALHNCEPDAHLEYDATTARLLRNVLKTGPRPLKPPRSFRGSLRKYQRAALGWMHTLARCHLGGCLADDSGLGKTVQVLALLEARRTRRLKGREVRRPSLIVTPADRVRHWQLQREQFVPRLQFHTHTDGSPGLEATGADTARPDSAPSAHVVLTTYQRLAEDRLERAETGGRTLAEHFDYVILDQARTIRNPATPLAALCRGIAADHRLALLEEPLEHDLNALWSIFEFLNPGLLSAFASAPPHHGNAPSSCHVLIEADSAASPSIHDTVHIMDAADTVVDAVREDVLLRTRDELAALIQPCYLRRTSQDVRDELPGPSDLSEDDDAAR